MIKTDNVEKDLRSLIFVLACRNYNKSLACYRFIVKSINENLKYFSITQFVNKIPDLYDNSDYANPKTLRFA